MDFINTRTTMESANFDMNTIITHLYEQSHIYGILIGMYFVYSQINNKINSIFIIAPQIQLQMSSLHFLHFIIRSCPVLQPNPIWNRQSYK
jgi:hypothetical protein